MSVTFDPTWRDRLEPERAAHRDDRHPADREQAGAVSGSLTAGAGPPDLRSGADQPAPARPRNMRAGRPRRSCHGRPRPGGMELRRLSRGNLRRYPRNSARTGRSSMTAHPAESQPSEIGARVDRVIARVRAIDGNVATVRPWPRPARAGGTLDRHAAACRRKLPARYRHAMRARPLSPACLPLEFGTRPSRRLTNRRLTKKPASNRRIIMDEVHKRRRGQSRSG